MLVRLMVAVNGYSLSVPTMLRSRGSGPLLCKWRITKAATPAAAWSVLRNLRILCDIVNNERFGTGGAELVEYSGQGLRSQEKGDYCTIPWSVDRCAYSGESNKARMFRGV